MQTSELYEITGFISYTTNEKPPIAHFISETFVEISMDNETNYLEKFSLIYHGEKYDRDAIISYYTPDLTIEEFVAKEVKNILKYDLIMKFGPDNIQFAEGEKETIVKATKKTHL